MLLVIVQAICLQKTKLDLNSKLEIILEKFSYNSNYY